MKVKTNSKSCEIGVECQEPEMKLMILEALTLLLTNADTKLTVQLKVEDARLKDLVPQLSEQFIQLGDPLVQMVQEHFQTFPEPTKDRPWIAVEDIFKFHEIWYKEKRLQPLNIYAFGKRMKKAFPFLKRRYQGTGKNRFWVYDGITFKTIDPATFKSMNESGDMIDNSALETNEPDYTLDESSYKLEKPTVTKAKNKVKGEK